MRLPEMIAHFPDGRTFRMAPRDAMSGRIYLEGEYEARNTALVRALLRPSDLAVDIGANHGWFSLAMATSVKPCGHVLAFEPVPPILKDLRRNLALNPQLPIVVHPCGLGARRGELELHLFAGLPHGHASASTLGRSDYTPYRVRVVPLDEALAGAEPALVKLDAEGAELDILRGAEGLLASTPPIWLMEVNWETSQAFGYQPPDLLQFIAERADYKFLTVDEHRLTPVSTPEHAPQGGTWLCVPARLMPRIPAAWSPTTSC
jgi:FkbM family methyltransferase